MRHLLPVLWLTLCLYIVDPMARHVGYIHKRRWRNSGNYCVYSKQVFQNGINDVAHQGRGLLYMYDFLVAVA